MYNNRCRSKKTGIENITQWGQCDVKKYFEVRACCFLQIFSLFLMFLLHVDDWTVWQLRWLPYVELTLFVWMIIKKQMLVRYFLSLTGWIFNILSNSCDGKINDVCPIFVILTFLFCCYNYTIGRSLFKSFLDSSISNHPRTTIRVPFFILSERIFIFCKGRVISF